MEEQIDITTLPIIIENIKQEMEVKQEQTDEVELESVELVCRSWENEPTVLPLLAITKNAGDSPQPAVAAKANGSISTTGQERATDTDVDMDIEMPQKATEAKTDALQELVMASEDNDSPQLPMNAKADDSPQLLMVAKVNDLQEPETIEIITDSPQQTMIGNANDSSSTMDQEKATEANMDTDKDNETPQMTTNAKPNDSPQAEMIAKVNGLQEPATIEIMTDSPQPTMIENANDSNTTMEQGNDTNMDTNMDAVDMDIDMDITMPQMTTNSEANDSSQEAADAETNDSREPAMIVEDDDSLQSVMIEEANDSLQEAAAAEANDSREPIMVAEENDSLQSAMIEEANDSISTEQENDTFMDDVDMDSEQPQQSLPEDRPTVAVDQILKDRNMEDDDMLMDHVLLPRVLSQKSPEKLFNTEVYIINQMTRIADDWATKGLPPKSAELLQMLMTFHIECNPKNISENINNLQPGDNFAMFVREQHCAILFHVPSKENADDIIVAVFPGSLDPSEIYIISQDSGIEVRSFSFLYEIWLKSCCKNET